MASNDMRQQANQLWKMLDDMADSDPNAYRRFINKQLENPPDSVERPVPLMCIQAAFLDDPQLSLFVNVFKWTRVPTGLVADTTAIPLFASTVFDDEMPTTKKDSQSLLKRSERTGHKIILVALHPDNASAPDLVGVIMHFAQGKVERTLRPDYKAKKSLHRGAIHLSINRMMEEAGLSTTPEAGASALLGKTPGQLAASGAAILVAGPSGAARMVEVQGEPPSLPEPVFKVSTTSDKTLVCVNLPGARQAITSSSLRLLRNQLVLVVPDHYQLILGLHPPIAPASVVAKFVSKSCSLYICMDVEKPGPPGIEEKAPPMGQ